MGSDTGETRRQRSAALFNNRYFSEVILAANQLATEDDLVTTRHIAAATGLADSLVRPVLLRLVDADMLDRLPKVGGSRTVQYFRISRGKDWLNLVRLAALQRSSSTA
jgi:hypothetical protein